MVPAETFPALALKFTAPISAIKQKMPLHWFTPKKGERGVNQRHYVEVLKEVVLPWIEETYGDKNIIHCFQQVS